MAIREAGIYEDEYYIPDMLPPKNPALIIDNEIFILFGEAKESLGQLKEVGIKLLNPDKGKGLFNEKDFIRAYVTKEALLSSAIENIHTTIIDIYTQSDTKSKKNKETKLVSNYIDAFDIAYNMIIKEGFPLTSRIILAAHKALMTTEDGESSSPGQYRRQSVKVGDLTPPPATQIEMLMSDLEKYMNEDSDLDKLIRIGLAHVQFETIHPFLDGNGRIGRLLIVLMLVKYDLLTVPILYPSYYLKKNQAEYYQKLNRVRTHGDFEGWIIFFLTTIRDGCREAYNKAGVIEAQNIMLKEWIKHDPAFSGLRETALLAVESLYQNPVFTIKELSESIGKSYNTAHNVIMCLKDSGKWVTEQTDQRRNKKYYFKPFLDILEEEYLER